MCKYKLLNGIIGFDLVRVEPNFLDTPARHLRSTFDRIAESRLEQSFVECESKDAVATAVCCLLYLTICSPKTMAGCS